MSQKSELITALEQIEKDKKIPKEDILELVQHAMASAYRKHHGQQINVSAFIDPDTGDISASVTKKLVDEVTDPEVEITRKEANLIPNAELTDTEVKLAVDATDFARIAAQTAKQVLIQKIREVERESLYEEYLPKVGTLMNGAVQRFANRNIIVDLDRAEAILPVREQNRRERWNLGERLRALILSVEKTVRGPEVVLSRTHPDFVRCLFEQEVPEIYEKTVEVLNVVREPGFRSKVVVRSNNPKVDPIGACVGVKGSRVRPIINELQGERIDLVSAADEISVFIGNALSPVKPLAVNIISHEQKTAEILVADDQLSLAIGKGGQNVRLAAKLTGWQLDVRSETQKREASASAAAEKVQTLSQLEGIGAKTAEILQKAGLTDIKRLSTAELEDLTGLSGVGEKMAERIIVAAKDFVEKYPDGQLPAEVANENASDQAEDVSPDSSDDASSISDAEEAVSVPEETQKSQQEDV